MDRHARQSYICMYIQSSISKLFRAFDSAYAVADILVEEAVPQDLNSVSIRSIIHSSVTAGSGVRASRHSLQQEMLQHQVYQEAIAGVAIDSD